MVKRDFLSNPNQNINVLKFIQAIVLKNLKLRRLQIYVVDFCLIK